MNLFKRAKVYPSQLHRICSATKDAAAGDEATVVENGDEAANVLREKKSEIFGKTNAILG